jgi:UDP-N-acetylglucosamine diphosphorylase/glucosamine-1-phosphate N-acetyltransferase
LEETPFDIINYSWDIFSLNDKTIRNDFEFLTQGRTSSPLSKTNQIVGDASLIFLEEGATVECSILNTQKGPIYIGKNAEIMEGCIIRGPLAMCEHSLLKMGAKIYGATTLGPHCKVGGEVNNTVLFGYSSKAHDGYLGNSVIGEWCNLGADTNTSNLKNTYEEVKLWDYTKNSFGRTGLQFLGLIMGDHSKAGINTMFNTGTVVGVSANVFGAGFPRNFIPSFTWGGPQGYETYDIKKAFYTMERVLARREIDLLEEDRDILKHIYEYSSQYRSWEKK